MADNLRFAIEVDTKVIGLEELARVNAAMQQAGETAGISSGGFQLFASVFKSFAIEGRNVPDILRLTADALGRTGQGAVSALPGFRTLISELERLLIIEKQVVNQSNEVAKSVERAARTSKFSVGLPGGRGFGGGGGSGGGDSSDRFSGLFGRLGGRIIGAELLTRGLGVPGAGYGLASLVGGAGLSSGAALGVLGGAAGLVAGVEAVKLAEQTAKYAQEQNNLAKETGMTAQEVQLFGRVAEVTGTHVSALFGAVNKMNDGMAQGGARSREIQRALQALGLDASVAFESPQAQLKDVLGALSKVGDESERVRLVVRLFGEEGRKLLPLVDSFNSVADAVRESGAIIDQEGIERLKRYREETKQLGLAWDALKDKLAIPVLGTITAVLQLITPGDKGYKVDMGSFRDANGQTPEDFGFDTKGESTKKFFVPPQDTGLAFGAQDILAGGTGVGNYGLQGTEPPHPFAGPNTEFMKAKRKEDINKRVEAARLSGLDEVGRLQREIRITQDDLEGTRKDQTEETPARITELNQQLTRQKAALAAAERRRSLGRSEQERSIEADKKAYEAYAAKILGPSPLGKLQAAGYKAELEKDDYLRKYEGIIPEARRQATAKREYEEKIGIAGQEFLNEEMKGKVRLEPGPGKWDYLGYSAGITNIPGLFDNLPRRRDESLVLPHFAIQPTSQVTFPEAVDVSGEHLDERITREQEAATIRELRLAEKESARGTFITPGFTNINRDIIAPPTDYVTMREQEKQVREFQRQGLENVRTQRTLGQVGGFQAAEADYDIRIRAADKERESAERRITLAENIDKITDGNEQRASAEAEKMEMYAQARLDKEREIASVTANQMHQFSSGFASIILGAQHGRAGPAVKGFLEGQESRLLENVGGMIFRRGAGGVLQSMGKSLPPWLTKGTLLESPGEKPEEKIKTGGELIKTGADTFHDSVRELKASIESTFKSTPGTAPPGGFPAIPGLNPPPSTPGLGGSTGIGQSGSFFSVPVPGIGSVPVFIPDSGGFDITGGGYGGTTLPANFPGALGAGSTLASLAPLMTFAQEGITSAGSMVRGTGDLVKTLTESVDSVVRYPTTGGFDVSGNNDYGGTTLPANFPGVLGAGPSLASLAPFLSTSGTFSGAKGMAVDSASSDYGAYGTYDSSGGFNYDPVHTPGVGTGSFMSGAQGVARGAGFLTSAYGGKGIVGAYGTIVGGSNPNAYTDSSGQSPSDWGYGNGPSGTATTGERVGAAAGLAGTFGAAAHGIKRASEGGASNILGGGGETLMAVGPLTGPAAPFVEAAGMVMELVSMALGDPKKRRAEEISKQIFTQHYQAPEAQNITESSSGGYSDTDMFGHIRTSKFSPYEVTSNSYLDVPRRTVVPGRVEASFGGPTDAPSAMNLPNPYFQAHTAPATPTYNVTIHAMDPSSFADVMNRNAPTVLDALHTQLQTAYHPIQGNFVVK